MIADENKLGTVRLDLGNEAGKLAAAYRAASSMTKTSPLSNSPLPDCQPYSQEARVRDAIPEDS